MHQLEALQKLQEEHQRSFEAEALSTQILEILERWSEKRNYHKDALILNGNSLFNKSWKSYWASKRVNRLHLLEQVR